MVVIIPRSTYVKKLQSMIDNGIDQGKYQPTTNTTMSDLTFFQDFLYRNFKNSTGLLDYSKIRPT